MEKKESKVFQAQVNLAKALSHENRLILLNLLMQSDKSVDQLVEESHLTTANVSKHLQVLLKAGLVINRKLKNFIFYSLASEDVADFLCHFFRIHDKIGSEIEVDQAGIFIDWQELENELEGEQILLLDVRPRMEYDWLHIEGAISQPLEDLLEKPVHFSKNQTIYVYCRGPYCRKAVEACQCLNRSGYQAKPINNTVKEWDFYQTKI